MQRIKWLSGSMWVEPNWGEDGGLEVYNPNKPYAEARLRIKDGVPLMAIREDAPRDFRNELNARYDQLVALLLLWR